MHVVSQGEQAIEPDELAVVPSWAEWDAEAESWTLLDEDTASRAYKLWKFAAELSDRSTDDVGRGAVVQKLWNAVDHRIRSLHEIYRLNIAKSVLDLPKATGSLDTLHQLGVVRPLIFKKLKDVRNQVKHQDRGAPNAIECSNLVDSVWYFLRSTDYLVMQRLSTYTLNSGRAVQGRPDLEQFVSISVSADWSMRIHGWLQEEHITADLRAAEFGVTLKLDRPPRRLETGDVFLSGSVITPSTGHQRLIRDYFAVELPLGAHSAPSK